MKDADRRIQRLKKYLMAVFFDSLASAVVLTPPLGNFSPVNDMVNDGACSSRLLQMQGKV